MFNLLVAFFIKWCFYIGLCSWQEIPLTSTDGGYLNIHFSSDEKRIMLLVFTLNPFELFLTNMLQCSRNTLFMELFSRRRWATGSAQPSSLYGILPRQCGINYFVFVTNTTAYHLGRYSFHLLCLKSSISCSIFEFVLFHNAYKNQFDA